MHSMARTWFMSADAGTKFAAPGGMCCFPSADSLAACPFAREPPFSVSLSSRSYRLRSASCVRLGIDSAMIFHLRPCTLTSCMICASSCSDHAGPFRETPPCPFGLRDDDPDASDFFSSGEMGSAAAGGSGAGTGGVGVGCSGGGCAGGCGGCGGPCGGACGPAVCPGAGACCCIGGTCGNATLGSACIAGNPIPGGSCGLLLGAAAWGGAVGSGGAPGAGGSSGGSGLVSDGGGPTGETPVWIVAARLAAIMSMFPGRGGALMVTLPVTESLQSRESPCPPGKTIFFCSPELTHARLRYAWPGADFRFYPSVQSTTKRPTRPTTRSLLCPTMQSASLSLLCEA